MKNCKNCIWFDPVLKICGNYICINQSEYEEFPVKTEKEK